MYFSKPTYFFWRFRGNKLARVLKKIVILTFENKTLNFFELYVSGKSQWVRNSEDHFFGKNFFFMNVFVCQTQMHVEKIDIKSYFSRKNENYCKNTSFSKNFKISTWWTQFLKKNIEITINLGNFSSHIRFMKYYNLKF